MDEFKDVCLQVVLPFCVIAAVGVCAIIGMGYALTAWSCSGYEKATGRETKYVHGICYGKIDGVWYSSDEYNKMIVPNRLKVE